MARRRRRNGRSLMLELGLLAAVIVVFYVLAVSGVGEDLARGFGQLVAKRMTDQTPSR